MCLCLATRKQLNAPKVFIWMYFLYTALLFLSFYYQNLLNYSLTLLLSFTSRHFLLYSQCLQNVLHLWFGYEMCLQVSCVELWIQNAMFQGGVLREGLGHGGLDSVFGCICDDVIETYGSCGNRPYLKETDHLECA